MTRVSASRFRVTGLGPATHVFAGITDGIKQDVDAGIKPGRGDFDRGDER